ncbi:hypothetical protein [Breoghania sp. JC706]|uniref:hypothetical protein n=1 Tax=Breoghania sp. JC706 TaxID=3117732 RepID=UPI0030098B9A
MSALAEHDAGSLRARAIPPRGFQGGPRARIAYTTFPGGRKRAVLLSPILPAWDEGAYFAPLLPELANAGYTTTIHDTLALVEPGMTFADLVSAWRARLGEGMPVDLIGGAALGGTVAQGLIAAPPFAETARALFVSSPTVVDDALSAALRELAGLAREVSAGACLRRLGELVGRNDTEEGATDAAPEDAGSQDPVAAARLALGFSALCEVDVSPGMEAYAGRLLHVVGDASRMVALRNVRVADPVRQHAFVVPGAGMRPLSDRGDAVRRRVRAFLADR